MKRLIHTVALAAALAALSAGLMRDCSVLTVFKKVVIAYLAFFFITSLLALVFKIGILAEAEVAEEQIQTPSPNKTRPGAGK